MRVFADLHIHGRFSRATSKMMNLRELSKFARIKGINLLGTADFTHPQWFSELKSGLREKFPGIYEYNGMDFLFSTEISLIYTQGGKGRKVHNVILAPDIDAAENITDWLKTRGRVDYDGRPIFGFGCAELVENLRGVDSRIEVIPAHVWTPHFGALGASSGFNSIEECFGDQAKHIHALETGLSSDPAMNWRLSSLDRYSLVSFSDSHSAWPWRLGREATVFDVREATYDNIIRAIRTGEGIAETLEFFPEEGKYHYDGHRACGVVMHPNESVKNNNVCPKCGLPLTIGVLHRVEELADREEGFVPKGAKPFRSLIPLSEIIASVLGIDQPFSKRVWSVHSRLIEALGSEYNVLLDSDKGGISKVAGPELAEVIVKVREGEIEIDPGYDGVYGKPLVGGRRVKGPREEGAEAGKQKSLADF